MASGELQQVAVTSNGQTGTITLSSAGVHLDAPTVAPAIEGTVTLTVPSHLIHDGFLSLEAS